MSEDNYVLIRKEQSMWAGYIETASSEERRYNRPAFKVTQIEDAIIHAQNTDTEYGYRFEGLGEDAT